MNKTMAYQIVMSFWALVFFSIGLLFLFTPSFFFESVVFVAHLFGLTGTIETPAQGFWYILTLSYMACIFLLAVFAARRPQDCILSSVIALAKVVSVVGFTCLAVREAPVWSVCAVADCFVVLTIILVVPKKNENI